jgi:hypothetical protein
VTTLYAEIDGKLVPLAACDWVLWGPCGCPFGVSMAATQHGVRAADEDAAWKSFYDTKREIAKAVRNGLRVELMSHEQYSREVYPRMKTRCTHG